MYEEIRNYLQDSSFRLIYTDRYLNIVNYLKIIILEETKMEIMIPGKILKIGGTNLKLKRIMNKELLIVGNINELKLVNL